MSKERVELDLLDRRLIRELDENCRLSYVELAKRLNAPAETVRYRLNSLTSTGVINAFYAVVDAGQLGCSVHKGLMKLHNVDENRVDTIINHLVAHPCINWVVRMDGIYDLSFTLWASSIAQVSLFIDELKRKFYLYITRIALAINVEAEFLPRVPSKNKRREIQRKARYTVPQSSYEIDAIDFSILSILGSNPRAAATAIAEQVGVSSETVAKRIHNLERRRVITGYRLVVDTSRTGEMNLYVLIYLNLVSADKITRFLEHCRAHPAVNYIIKALGEWDYELNVEVESFLGGRALMMELTREFADMIRDYHVLPVSHIHKFMIMPPGAPRPPE